MSEFSCRNNPPESSLEKFGWAFGTYPKVCPHCPPGNEFLGTKDSTLCQPHAAMVCESRTNIVIMDVIRNNKSAVL